MAGWVHSGAGLADSGAGLANSGAGLADSGAGRADSGASPPTDTALSCPAHSYCTGCRGDVEQRRPHHLQHRPQCRPERVPELPGWAAAHGQRHADDVRAASQGSPHGGEQAVPRPLQGSGLGQQRSWPGQCGHHVLRRTVVWPLAGRGPLHRRCGRNSCPRAGAHSQHAS